MSASHTASAPGIQRPHRPFVAGINPVAKLAASGLIAVPLVLTLDVVSAAVAVALECVLFLFAGLSWRTFWLRTAPV